MLGELTREQIDHVLRSEIIGRIGCHAEGRTFVVPVSYTYDGECVYAHSSDGLKIRTMRANPKVCFEVEQIDDYVNWRGVIAWGTYEELTGADEDRAWRLLHARLQPFVTSESACPDRELPSTSGGSDPRPPMSIFYRIRLEERTGRFEKH